MSVIVKMMPFAEGDILTMRGDGEGMFFIVITGVVLGRYFYAIWDDDAHEEVGNIMDSLDTNNPYLTDWVSIGRKQKHQ